jgi:hypothetical protein
MSEPEAAAAKKVAKVLKSIRQAVPPPIDRQTLVREAASVAVQTVAERDNAKALDSGLKEFRGQYADIAADPDLFAMADRRTTAIAEEHPDWSPTQVMLEAGKQTRDWMTERGMKAPVATASQPNLRQQRKDGLVPMPQARSAARPAAQTEEEQGQAPQSYMAELRKARGQPS